MPQLHLDEIALALNATVINGGKNPVFLHYHFDTRLVTEPNTLFFRFKNRSRRWSPICASIKRYSRGCCCGSRRL